MTKRTRTPQEKKELSYARDGRNLRAESRSKAHKAISRRKAKANRAFRREEKLATSAATAPGVDDVFVARISRRSWKKMPDVSLGTYVARLLDRREQRGMSPVHKQSRTLASGLRRDRRDIGLWLGGLVYGRTSAASRIRAAADAAQPGANA
ncbi:MAG TPA: hypothetical protein VE871_18570 [Longimicrobium sp.]|nr:hypothetical protein [Longimicrobium sp.]